MLLVINLIVEILYKFLLFHHFCIVQVMTCRPRADLFINLPALRKLDNMLIVRAILALFVTSQLQTLVF